MENTAVNKRLVRQIAPMAKKFRIRFFFMFLEESFPMTFRLLLRISSPPVSYNPAVFDPDDPVTELSQFLRMGDHYNRLRKPGVGQFQQSQYLLRSLGIQVPGRLIC